MKYCEEYAALLDLYVDAELTDEEMQRVEAHLAECPDCRAYVDDALSIRAAFADMDDVEVPAGFADSVCEIIRAQGAPRKAKKAVHWGRTLASLAACCAVVVLLRFGPVSNRGDASAPMMKSANTAAAESAMADMAAPAEEAMWEAETEACAVDADNGAGAKMSSFVADSMTADAEEAIPETATEPAEEKKEITAEAEAPQGAEAGQSANSAATRYAMELWLPAECADLLADAVPFRETDTHFHYEMTRDECLLLQGRMAEKGYDGVIGMSAEPTTELALVVLSK